MSEHKARVSWRRDGAKFTDNKYSRLHEWSFDGGVTVPASSAPGAVPPPYSVAEAVDPEEAVVAAASSCHMLWFLSLAAKRGFVVESYVDDAAGTLGKRPDGRIAFEQITLRPAIVFSAERAPSADDLSTLHHTAHERCYIANSLTCDVVIEAR